MSYGIQIIKDIEDGDAQFLLVLMWDHWNQLFRQDLSFVERSLISELRDFRNRWAHQGPMSENDIYRVLDGIERLLCDPQRSGCQYSELAARIVESIVAS